MRGQSSALRSVVKQVYKGEASAADTQTFANFAEANFTTKGETLRCGG